MDWFGSIEEETLNRVITSTCCRLFVYQCCTCCFINSSSRSFLLSGDKLRYMQYIHLLVGCCSCCYYFFVVVWVEVMTHAHSFELYMWTVYAVILCTDHYKINVCINKWNRVITWIFKHSIVCIGTQIHAKPRDNWSVIQIRAAHRVCLRTTTKLQKHKNIGTHWLFCFSLVIFVAVLFAPKYSIHKFDSVSQSN